MQKHLLYINLFTITSALALAACADEVDGVVTPDAPEVEVGEKTPIELSVGGMEGGYTTTRSVVTTAKENMKSLTEGTHLFMLMKSDYVALTDANADLNYGGASAADAMKTAKYTTTRGKVGADNKIVFEDDATNTRTRYWDDAHARSSRISIWALACDGLESLGGTGTSLTETNNIFYNSTASYNANANSTVASNVAWRTDLINAKLIQWNVPHGDGSAQNETSVKNRDLLFSNNLADYTSSDISKDNRLKFDETATPKAFQGGKLVFYHALSKIIINLKIGDGFTGSGDFLFPSSQNVKLNHFNIWGQFSAEDGEFLSVNNAHVTIGSVWNHTGETPSTTSDFAYELEALVLPSSTKDTKSVKGSRFISGNNDIMMEFTIDGSIYKISSDLLFKSLHLDSDLAKGLVSNATKKTENETSYIPVEAGKKYVFTFKIGKKKIDNITAQVVDWETVQAEENNPNVNTISVTTAEVTSNVKKDGTFDLYRLPYVYDGSETDMTKVKNYNWPGRYSDKAMLSKASDYSTTYKWNTSNWYYDNNKTFYHFRAVSPTATAPETSTVKAGATGGDDYLELTAAATKTDQSASYTDVLWGAPFTGPLGTNNKYGYSFESGYDYTRTSGTNTHQIHEAITTTLDPINLLMFHMMSDVTFTITTTEEDKADKVLLHKTENGVTKDTKVELKSIYTTGKVLMGNGKIEQTGSSSLVTLTLDTYTAGQAAIADPATAATAAKSVYKHGMVPQSLSGVKVVITTADDNVYEVALDKFSVSTAPNPTNLANPYSATDGKYVLNYWYPGFKYNYIIKLKKTGIEKLTASIVEWEEISADEEEVVIQ